MLLKGRQNYVCPLRLERALAAVRSELFTSTEQAELKRIWRNGRRPRQDGTLERFPVEPDPKSGRRFAASAHLHRENVRAKSALLLPAGAQAAARGGRGGDESHALFHEPRRSPEEQEERENGYLFANDFVIFDEAHTVEQVASRQIGIGVSQYGLRATPPAALQSEDRRRGSSRSRATPTGVTLAASLVEEVDAFSTTVGERADFRRGASSACAKPDFVTDSLTAPLAELQARRRSAAQDRGRNPEGGAAGPRPPHPRCPRRDRHFLKQRRRITSTGSSRPARRAEYHAPRRAGRCRAGPARMLFRDDYMLRHDQRHARRRPARIWLISATGRRGRSGPAADRQPVRLPAADAALRHAQDARPARRRLQEALAEQIEHFVEETGARLRPLHQLSRDAAARARRWESSSTSSTIKLLVQGEGMPRTGSSRNSRTTTRTCSSAPRASGAAWMCRARRSRTSSSPGCPSPCPDHPLIEARLELIEAHGGDPFTEYSLPEAILKLRQGVGRLIRTKSDSGIVVILDNRILTKSYGRAFLKALPKCPVKIF